MTRAVHILAMASLPALGACTAPFMEPEPTVIPVQEETIISSTASTSNTLVLKKDTDFVTCTAPAPDASFSQSSTARVDASVAGNSDDAAMAEGSASTAMPGRSPAVLMTRELFFRACEFSRNYELTKHEAHQLYMATMKAAQAGWAAEAKQTTVSVGDAQIAPVTNQTFVAPDLMSSRPVARSAIPAATGSGYASDPASDDDF